ncbi:hypothetical protein ElyMa_001701400 [Elysia marginata]|uniref:Uncharacterized protein n=1 Tax=Elysia marginata TaxID=1093978 RepID=A0AAV4JZF0_9GAST|nr:hypothetical protein ElyMa_001701400 [Elysia marginata]
MVDLPAPDSPTSPRISPFSTVNDTSCTATAVPCRDGNSIRKSFTSSKDMHSPWCSLLSFRISYEQTTGPLATHKSRQNRPTDSQDKDQRQDQSHTSLLDWNPNITGCNA